MYPLSGDHHVHGVVTDALLHRESHLASRLALHHLAGLLAAQRTRVLAVDAYYLVAAAQTVAVGRRILVWLVDIHTVADLFVDNGSYASVSLVYEIFEILILLFGHIYGVGIELRQHRVYAGTHHPVERQAVHIAAVEFAYQRTVYFLPLSELEGAGLGGHRHRRECEGQTCGKGCRLYQYMLHILQN